MSPILELGLKPLVELVYSKAGISLLGWLGMSKTKGPMFHTPQHPVPGQGEGNMSFWHSNSLCAP